MLTKTIRKNNKYNLLYTLVVILAMCVPFRASAQYDFYGINPTEYYEKQNLILSSANDILNKIAADSVSDYENDVFKYKGTNEYTSEFGKCVYIKKREDAYLLKFLEKLADIDLQMGLMCHLHLNTYTDCLEKLSEFYNSMPPENLFPYWLIFVLDDTISEYQFMRDYSLWFSSMLSNQKVNPNREYEDFIEENPESIFSKNYQIMLTTNELSRMIKGILKSLQSSSKESIINQLINK